MHDAFWRVSRRVQVMFQYRVTELYCPIHFEPFDLSQVVPRYGKYSYPSAVPHTHHTAQNDNDVGRACGCGCRGWAPEIIGKISSLTSRRSRPAS